MDHDLLMMLYGAGIGLGSSLITSLFQSWLNRRERERKERDDQKKELRKIYTPTLEETRTITRRRRIHDDNESDRSMHFYWPPMIFVFAIICIYLVVFVILEDSPIWYLLASASFSFGFGLLIISIIKQRTQK